MKNEDKKQLDYNRSQAAKFYIEKYSREQRHLIILSRDLKDEVSMIRSLGIEKAREFQKFWDFICDFEKLQSLMKEFKWTPEFMKKNGIDFKSYRKLYFAVA